MLSALKAILGIKQLISIKTKKKKIFFYSENKNYRGYFLPLIKELKKNLDYKIFYFTSDIKDLENIEEDLCPIYIGERFIRLLFFQLINCDFMIMTLSNIGENQIKKVKTCKNYIYFFHSFCSTHKCYEKFAFKNYDTILTVSDFQNKELEKAENIYNLPKKKIFTVGYFYYEYLKKKIFLNQKIDKYITYAPSWSRDKKNLFKDYSINIISRLLKLGFFVTMRTHPESIKREKKLLLKIKEKFKNESKFKLNINLEDISPFEKSELLITDNGGVGLEYGLIYQKPILYIDYKEKIHNFDYKDLNIEPLEDKFKRKFGFKISVNQLESLKKIISDIKKNFNYQNSGMDSFFKDYNLKEINASVRASKVIKKLI